MNNDVTDDPVVVAEDEAAAAIVGGKKRQKISDGRFKGFVVATVVAVDNNSRSTSTAASTSSSLPDSTGIEDPPTFVGLSSRYCCDVDRWRDEDETIATTTTTTSSGDAGTAMPSLKDYPYLRTLDLYNQRYITLLNESLTTIPSLAAHLETLSLNRCSRLAALPASIGRLRNLKVVRVVFCKVTVVL